jgi:large subunit ribosomal protein L9
LGDEGQKVEVRAGFARNYLLPKKLAVPMNEANRKQMESLNRARGIRLAKELSSAEEVAARLRELPIAIPVKTGPGGRLFGSVTAADLRNRLGEEGLELDRKQLSIEAPIKTLGKHTAAIKLHYEVSVDLEFEVVSENPIEEGD